MLILDGLKVPEILKLNEIKLPETKKSLFLVERYNKEVLNQIKSKFKHYKYFQNFIFSFLENDVVIETRKYRQEAVMEKLLFLQKRPFNKLDLLP